MKNAELWHQLSSDVFVLSKRMNQSTSVGDYDIRFKAVPIRRWIEDRKSFYKRLQGIHKRLIVKEENMTKKISYLKLSVILAIYNLLVIELSVAQESHFYYPTSLDFSINSFQGEYRGLVPYIGFGKGVGSPIQEIPLDQPPSWERNMTASWYLFPREWSIMVDGGYSKFSSATQAGAFDYLELRMSLQVPLLGYENIFSLSVRPNVSLDNYMSPYADWYRFGSWGGAVSLEYNLTASMRVALLGQISKIIILPKEDHEIITSSHDRNNFGFGLHFSYSLQELFRKSPPLKKDVSALSQLSIGVRQPRGYYLDQGTDWKQEVSGKLIGGTQAKKVIVELKQLTPISVIFVDLTNGTADRLLITERIRQQSEKAKLDSARNCFVYISNGQDRLWGTIDKIDSTFLGQITSIETLGGGEFYFEFDKMWSEAQTSLGVELMRLNPHFYIYLSRTTYDWVRKDPQEEFGKRLLHDGISPQMVTIFIPDGVAVEGRNTLVGCELRTMK